MEWNQAAAAMMTWFASGARDLPWRRTLDPYAIWISEIMLQQTQVRTVIPYWERWMQAFPNVAVLAAADPAQVLKMWEGLGYYSRARNIHRAAQLIVARHGGRFPRSFDEVLDLPGIGRYTAGAVCSIAYNQPRPVLDGNVVRVLSRLCAVREEVRSKQVVAGLWAKAETLVLAAADLKPVRSSIALSGNCSCLNQALMELGATVCTPSKPQCLFCPVRIHCKAAEQGIQEQLPNLGKKTAATRRLTVAFVCEHRGRFLVRQRPDGVVNAHLWEFPVVELHSVAHDSVMECFDTAWKQADLAGEHGPVQHLCTVRHSITRYRFTLHAFRISLKSRPSADGQWLPLEQLEILAFPSAHRKVLMKVGVLSAEC